MKLIESNIKEELFKSLLKVDKWLEKNDYKGYEPFDGLSSYLRLLTFKNKFLRQCLQQFVLRYPFNSRKYLGIKKNLSSKAMGFFAKGYLKLYLIKKSSEFRNKCEYCFNSLLNDYSKSYSGLSWGNSFDYQSRSAYIPKGEPTVVWTSLIGHSFLDAYAALNIEKYKDAAFKCGEFILKSLPKGKFKEDGCISYLPFLNICIHNSNMLAASLLARLYSINPISDYLTTARKAMKYSVSCQLANGAWFYGEQNNLHWIDNWHTAYNLDSLKYYSDYAKDHQFSKAYRKGVEFYMNNFFLTDGTPKYYWNKLHVADIQSAGQAIESLVIHSDTFPEALEIAKKVAIWTIKNMQDEDGHFYYRKYRYITNKTPMIHWGQSTMFSGLSHLYHRLSISDETKKTSQ